MRWLALCLSFLSLCGCAQMRAGGPGDAGSRPLVSPSSLNGERAANQVVRGAFGAREMTISCVVTVRDGIFTVVGLTAMGVRAFTIRYDGNEVKVDNDLPVPPQLTAERLLADIQLVYWPLEILRSGLQRAGWQLVEPYAGARRLRRGDKIVAEIHYSGGDPWRGRSWLVNLEYGYTLSIDSNPLDP
jgi:hypothetical protein